MTTYPSDWPGPGPIDLSVHDLPHASATTEWWYQNGHCVAEDGGRYSFFAAFFRQVKGRDPQTRAPLYAYSITWALSALDDDRFVAVSRVDRSAPAEGLKRIRRGLGGKDDKFNRSLEEILERGHVPLPDRLFEGEVAINPDRLELRYGSGAVWEKNDDGTYHLELDDAERGVGLNLTFELQKPPTRHGDDGVVRGSDDETMFYYFVPRCRLAGTLTYEGEVKRITEGQGWYDHEFGFGDGEDEVDDEAEAKLDAETRARVQRERRDKHLKRQVAWDWLSTQLDDGSEISIYSELYVDVPASAGQWAVVIDPTGERSVYKDVQVEALEIWRSTQTFFEYPVKWRFVVPSAGIDLVATAAYPDQEFITLISKPSFWEGRVAVEGSVAGEKRSGVGILERSGYASYEDLEGFFEEVGKVVRSSVERVIPRAPSYEQATALIASKNRAQYMRGVDIAQYARTHLHPIRDIVDRGGKGWRSYAAHTCVDIVGGDSRKFVEWIALPELMHVGSLIVDDVEDKSVTRRGGPTVHTVYGEAQAINSGTAAYFIGVHLLNQESVSERNRLRLYDLYFEALRAGHAGQAIDIDGFEEIMPTVVESGDSEALEDRVLAVHRLKTAAPAGCMARMGAIAGGGSEEQIEALGLFFEDLGLAFQIIDDVLNLRGFKGDLKAKAEDIMQGKLTLPVAKAMSRLERPDRAWLWETLQQKPQDECVVKLVLEKLEGCGAVEACDRQARALVEEGWTRLEPKVDDSLSKMLLRAFGWYVLERHY